MLGYEAAHSGDALNMPPAAAAAAATFSLSAYPHSLSHSHSQSHSHPHQQQYAAYLQHQQHQQQQQQQHQQQHQYQQAAAQHSQNLQLMQQLNLDPLVISRLQLQHTQLQQQQQQLASQPPPAGHSNITPSQPSLLKHDSSLPSHQLAALSHPSSSPSSHSSSSAPSSSSSSVSQLPPSMFVLSKTQTQQTLAHHLNTRRTPAELAGKGILYDTGKKGQASARVQQRQKELRRQMEKDRLSAFIANRPTLDELVRGNLVEDTMTWTRQTMAGQIPTPRNCHSIAHIRPAAAANTSTSLGQLCLLGGYGTGQQSSELLCLSLDDPLGPMWSRPAVAGVVPCERYSHTMNAIGGTLILFGGLTANGSGSWLNDLHILDTHSHSHSHSHSHTHSSLNSSSSYNSYNTAPPTTSSSPSPYPAGVLSWYQPSCHGSSPPCPRAAHSAAVIGSTLFIFAGNDGKQLFNDLYCLHLPTLTWSSPQQYGHIPSPRAGHTMNVLPGERLIVFGGGNANGPTNDLHILDTRSMTWTRPSVYGTPPSPRAGHTACTVFGAELLVFGGGYLNKVFNDLHLFNSDSGVWSRPSDTGTVPIPRAGHTSSVIGSRIYTFAGGDADDVFNDLHLLDTSFFRMTELMADGGARDDSGGGGDDERCSSDADVKRAAVLISHSMSAPTSPSSHIRRISEADGGQRSMGEGGVVARLVEYQSSMAALLATAIRELEVRQREREDEETEVIRVLAAGRERRKLEYGTQMESMQRMQLLLAAHMNDMREAVKQHNKQQRTSAPPTNGLRDIDTLSEADEPPPSTAASHVAAAADAANGVVTEAANTVPIALSSNSPSSSSSVSPPSRFPPPSSSSSSFLSSSASPSSTSHSTSSRRKSPRKKVTVPVISAHAPVAPH